jgi:hypothetical protein
VAVTRVASLAPNRAGGVGGVPVDGEAPRIRAVFDRLARDLTASRFSCAAVRELVGPVLANR